VLTLKLRVAPELWARVSQRQPDLDRTIQQYLREEATWIISQPSLEVDGEKGTAVGSIQHTITTHEHEFHLTKPPNPDAAWDYDITDLRMRRTEQSGEVQSARIEGEIAVYNPSNAPALSVDAPRRRKTKGEGAPKGESADTVVFMIQNHKYKPLAPHLKEHINMAWQRIRQGRTTRRVFMGEDTIFILTSSTGSPSTPEDATNLQEALEQADAGRLITDPYEQAQARKLADKYGDNPPQANGATTQ